MLPANMFIEPGLETGYGQARINFMVHAPLQQGPTIPPAPGAGDAEHVEIRIPLCEGAVLFEQDGTEAGVPVATAPGAEVRVAVSKAGLAALCVAAGIACGALEQATPPVE